MAYTTLMCPHWVPLHRAASDKDVFARWHPPFVKIVWSGESIAYLEDVPADAKIIVRSYELSENFGNRGFGSETPEAMAVKHAAFYKKQADDAVRRGISLDRLVFEGINEPMVWSIEPPNMLARYYRNFAIEMHKFGLNVCVGNFGVGWPSNTGPDTPVAWDFFKPVIEVMTRNDYLGLHEYWGMNGPGENWRWWAGRYEQCPFDVNILITECGIDLGVIGSATAKQGWMNIMPGASIDAKADRYIGELFWYEDKMRADGRIKGAFIYSYDGNRDDWGMFSIDTPAFLDKFIPAANARGPLPETVVKPPTLAETLAKVFGAKFADLRATLPKHATLRYATRPASQVKRIVVHHGGSAVTTWQNIARYHVQSKGWPGIGYHFGIDPDGKVNWLNDITTHSYHAGDANSDSIGICFNGDYSTILPTDAALEAYAKLAAIFKLPAFGHRDVSAGTVCPGNALYARLFKSQPAKPPKPSVESVRGWAWDDVQIPYVPTNAICKFARENDLGAPVSEERDLGDWVLQGFAKRIVLYTKATGACEVITW